MFIKAKSVQFLNLAKCKIKGTATLIILIRFKTLSVCVILAFRYHKIPYYNKRVTFQNTDM